MFSANQIVFAFSFATLCHGHAQILNAQGIAGSPASVGFQVVPELARNCTTISPCQQDATLIRDAEIIANVVNECGRTELSGNIDVGENTENALTAKAVTQVRKGSEVTVTIHQVNADGAGPFVCDLDPTGNSLGVSGQTPLQVTNNVPGVNGFSQAKAQDFNITIKMPNDLACIGASTGNVCTVRCRNNALAGPFGGCFAVQQVDTTPKVNTPQNIATAQTLKDVQEQVQQDIKDLPVAVKANADAGSGEAKQNLKAIEALLNLSVKTSAFPQQTPVVDASVAAAATAATATAAAAKQGGQKGGDAKSADAAKQGNAKGAKEAANSGKSAATEKLRRRTFVA